MCACTMSLFLECSRLCMCVCVCIHFRILETYYRCAKGEIHQKTVENNFGLEFAIGPPVKHSIFLLYKKYIVFVLLQGLWLGSVFSLSNQTLYLFYKEYKTSTLYLYKSCSLVRIIAFV